MLIARTIADITEIVRETKRQGKKVEFVPTMGFLHEGHLSLLAAAKEQDSFIVLSIFVNPLQFGPNEDFDRYPRDFKRDEAMAKSANVDVIFYPDVKEIYPNELTCLVNVQKGVNVLCGKSRPGHFDGVATVVLKLFNIIKPTRAYFGMKDAQQVAVIENMVTDLNLLVEIIKCPTLREKDGLAKSSRNVYLKSEEREMAREIYVSLRQAIGFIEMGERNPETLKRKINAHLKEHTNAVIDYVEILTYPGLEPVEPLQGKVIIAIALKFANVRLIDNVTITI
ncbi:pantoate--beta-alanine ligase [Bacillaceae bacterium IKA-2]|nr:pantoate--beta-alanine ligase [Bacillaceae bacterium IKA-2]